MSRSKWTRSDTYALALAIVEAGDTPSTRAVLKQLRQGSLTNADATDFIARVESSRAQPKRRRRRDTRVAADRAN